MWISSSPATGTTTLRAPDVAVGGVPDAPGWIAGTPALAVEYAGSGQVERDLQQMVVDLLQAGTRWVWVVRLVGPRRVEIHEAGQPMRTIAPGGTLTAPGLLQNPVPVEALYDRAVAHEVTSANLLQRKGYANLDAVLVEGKLEGKAEAVLEVLAARSVPIGTEARARILASVDPVELAAWLRRALVASNEGELFGP